MKKVLKFVTVVSFLLFSASGALALSFDLEGVNYSYNTAEVGVFYEYTGGYGVVDISIKNTSQYDPIITGFAFNTPSEITSLVSFTGPSGWNSLFQVDSISTPEPFGFFDAAEITGSNMNGGDPQVGIPQGATFNFNIVFDGTGLDLLTADSFLSELSYVPIQGAGSNGAAVNFLARIQQVGPNGELSDVMVGASPVPEPATMLLFGIGIITMAGIRGRNNNKNN